MTDLLDQVLAAHGGLERWQQARTLRARAAVGGELWGRRGQEGVLRDAHVRVDLHAQGVVFDGFKASDRRGVFAPDRDAIETTAGEVLEERLDAASAFVGQTPTTQWDDLQLVHSAGFDLWHFFTQPFMLTMADVHTEEIEPWEEAGETWRRLKAVFPPGLVAHAREQVYSFNREGLLRRFEYKPARPGVPANVNYVADHRSFDGLVLATRRRMLPSDPDGRARPHPTLMTIDVAEVTFA